MKPYDWCDPRCPNPCSCQATIEANIDKKHEGHATPDPTCPLCRSLRTSRRAEP